MAIIDAQRTAIDTVRARFMEKYRKDKPFRYTIRAGRDGWFQVVCVDTRRKPVRGIASEEYRPLITDRQVRAKRRRRYGDWVGEAPYTT